MVALNSKTKLELHSYNELEKDKDDYLFGQAIWLAHIESKTFLTYQHSEKQKEREAAIFH